MKKIKRILSLFLTLVMILTANGAAFASNDNEAQNSNEVTYPNSISSTSVWSYLDDGSDPAGDKDSKDYNKLSWSLLDFDDSKWKSASGSFGCKKGAISDLGNGCIPNTLVNQYKDNGDDLETFFFRTKVSVSDVNKISEIKGSLLYDDCAIIYINGVKIASFDADSITENIQYGGSNAAEPKTGTISVTDKEIINKVLVNGVNEVAVEIHQGRAASSDLYFDMTSLTFETMADEETANVETKQSQSSISLDIGADESQLNISWYNNDDSIGQIIVAKTSELENGVMPENAKIFTATVTSANKSGYYSNQATMTDLEASTEYAYQLVNGTHKSEIYNFTTADETSVSFALAGDPQIGASGSTSADTERWEDTLNTISNSDEFEGVDFLLSVGDQVNTNNDESQYDGFLDHSVLYSLPLASNIGNHDSGSNSYGQHFNVANESTQYGSTAAGSDYYYVYNNVLFLCLNSNNLSTAEHKAFMEEAIKATENDNIDWKVVTFHHSIYSVANHASESDILQRRTEWVPLFEELDIDVVLMGHDHVYCRTYMMDGLTAETDASIYDDENMTSVTDPNGILYVTVNSASGSKYYNIQNTTFEYAAVMNQEKVPNISRVDVTDSSFTITTYRTSDMSVVDTFTINHTKQETQESDESMDESPVINYNYVSSTVTTSTENNAKTEGDSTIGTADVSFDTANHNVYANGYDGNVFKPDNCITRAETAKMLYNLLSSATIEKYGTNENSFSDVDSDSWYNTAVSTLVAAGAISGYSDGTFKPNQSITRAEFVKMVMSIVSINSSATPSFNDTSSSAWYSAAVGTAQKAGYVEGSNGNFRPTENMSRAEAVTFLNRVLGRTADVTFIKNNLNTVTSYTDVSPNSWYYEAVMEATNGHNYVSLNSSESWTAIK